MAIVVLVSRSLCCLLFVCPGDKVDRTVDQTIIRTADQTVVRSTYWQSTISPSPFSLISVIFYSLPRPSTALYSIPKSVLPLLLSMDDSGLSFFNKINKIQLQFF